METQLCSAIASHLIIEFDYDGHHRVANPHTVFIAKNGNATLEAWQTGGTSKHTPPPDWGNFNITKITNLVITDAQFPSPQPDYNSARHSDCRCHL